MSINSCIWPPSQPAKGVFLLIGAFMQFSMGIFSIIFHLLNPKPRRKPKEWMKISRPFWRGVKEPTNQPSISWRGPINFGSTNAMGLGADLSKKAAAETVIFQRSQNKIAV